MKRVQLHVVLIGSLFLFLSILACPRTEAAVMNDYCIQPPFISQSVPPLLMFTMDKEHRLFTEAYSDSFDLDEDGKVETTYKHSIKYYGFFDFNKCYTYSTTASEFNPVSYSATVTDPVTGNAIYSKLCSSGQWSGNILNWLSMSRMDVLKKVLYGGQRTNPDSTNKTTLVRASVPHDAHAFGKEYTGRLCTANGVTYSSMCSVDSDCTSGETCEDKSLQLIGVAAPPQVNTCTYTTAIDWSQSGNILVAKYNHASGAPLDVETGADTPSSGISAHQNLMNSFVPANFVSSYYLTDFNVDDTTAANKDIIPNQNHGNNNSFIAVAEFNVANSKKGDWQFALDSDDGAELYIDGTPVASFYSVSGSTGHSWCSTAPTTLCDPSAKGTINLSASGYHRLVVRVTNYLGGSGAKVWYKRPGDAAWTIFGQSAILDIRSPNIPSTSANCTMQTDDFIVTGQPTKGTQQQYHLFCNRSTFGNNSVAGMPKLRMLTNRTERIWDWISREVTQCESTLGTGTAVTPTDFNVVVEVCNSNVGLESNCKQYGTGVSATQKPIGLLQKFGDSDGTKVCSKSMSKPCSSDADCRPGNNSGNDLGMCVDKSRMYFGLITGSYTHNLQGGVLRKNILSISDEVDTANGFFKSSQNIPSNMLETFDKLQIVDYTDNANSYSTCVNQNEIIVDGKCRVWGNPLAEIMYESLRYFAGKGVSTAIYDYPQNQSDGGLNLPHPPYWGYVDGARTFKGPYDIYPSCAKPFILLMSDVYPSFDADQLPGVTGTSYAEDTSVHPVLGLDTTVGGKKFLSKLLDDIAVTEAVTGNNFFIGDNGSTYDFICTPKSASGMSLLRGLCPEQPTRKGSFYSAALAYYAHSFMNAEIKKDTTSGINNIIPNATTFSVAVASQVGNWFVKVNGKTLRIVPLGKSISGAVNMDTTCKNNVTLATTNFSDGTLKTMSITPKNSNAYCPTNEIVKVYTHSVKYDVSGNPIYLSFRVNYADAEQGADFDMDAVGWYEVCTQAAKNAGYGTCGTNMNADQVEIKVVSDYAAGGIDQVLGFVASGSSEDGTYLVVRDKSVTAGASLPNSLPFNWSHIFTVTGSTTQAFKDPLWYAAKWGGFEDKNGNDVPDQRAEWAKNCVAASDADCNPDNYYLVTNPLKLESQMERAFNDILRRVSSGTAASILNNSEGSGANLLQAVFYPIKSFDANTEVSWIGEMQNLWYYIDPKLRNTSIREDSNNNNILNLKQDKIAQFYFDPSQSKTLVKLFSDSNGDGIADNPNTPDATKEPDYVNSLWKAGSLLWQRNLATDPRTIYTGYNSTAGSTPQRLINADGSVNSIVTQSATLDLLDIPSSLSTTDRQAKATKLVNYLHGKDQDPDADGTKYRARKVTIGICSNYKQIRCSASSECPSGGTCNSYNQEWKLGDIISSTPRIVSNVKLNAYDLTPPTGYNDLSYSAFANTTTYKTRGMAFVGGNDGMLHAFKLGVLKELNPKFDKAQINDSSGNLADASDNLGREEWAYIPKQSLPYLKYLADPDYSHLYFIDRTPTIVDASIGVTSEPCSGDYSTCTKKFDGTTWRTVLIGGMGFGGANKNSTDTCTSGSGGTCVKTPVDGTGFSSYFALDVTDPANPKKMWDFYGDPNSLGTLGYSLTGPAIVRIAKKVTNGNPDNTKNGKWFAVFGSGPSGPIDTTKHEFKGESTQNMKVFVVDLATGDLVTTIDTGIANAFSGSLASSWIDTDRSKQSSQGYYSDDAIYIGYSQKDTSTNTWTKGGVVRVLTRENEDPGQWSTSVLIDGVGPVTSSITKLQDRANKNLWIYFGTGRFFFRTDDNAATSQQKLIGVREPCYSTANRTMMTPKAGGTDNDIDQSCSDKAGSLVDQTWTASQTPTSALAATAAGWYINLYGADSQYLAERVITDPVASPAGALFYTTFSPSADICKFGGDTSLFAVNYANGSCPPCTSIQGKGLMQVSTGAFAEINLSDSFCCTTCQGNCKTETPPVHRDPLKKNKRKPTDPDERRLPDTISGVPPTAQGLSLITNPPPVKKFLHVKEK